MRGVNVNTESKFHDDDFVYIDKEWADTEFSKFTCECDDVILCHKGTLGKIGIIPESSKFSKYIMGNSMMKVRTNNEKLTALFLYYWLISSAGQNHIFNRVSQVGVPQIQRPLTTLREAKLQHPPLPEQKAIAAVLGSLDDKIELLREQNETLEALAQTLFKRWFIDFNFPDENGNPYKDSGGKMIPSELGEIPEGWNVSNISECSEHIKISVKPDKHPTLTYNHYSLPAFDNGMQPVNEHGSEIKSNKYEVLPNSILVSKLNPGTPRIWQIQLVPENSICSTEFQVVKPRGETFGYVYSAVKTPAYTRELSGRAGGTSSSHQRVSPTDIFDVPLAMSENLEFEEQFSLIMGVSLEKLDHNRSKIQTLTALRDTLLPKLMNGEVRVPVDA